METVEIEGKRREENNEAYGEAQEACGEGKTMDHKRIIEHEA
jgi:hypothetical protein